ncbi:MAG: zinc ribbon domain-containing protein [Candidatus Cryptobacteroides sp.]
MGTFNTKKTLYGPASMIPEIANAIRDDFSKDGYEVSMDALSSGGYDISITKGGLFKAVLGMKTALKVSLFPQDNGIHFEAGVGIFGQQAIPTVISMLFFWPVLLTQMWGMIEQSRLDDRALQTAQDVIARSNYTARIAISSGTSKFCTNCGTRNDESAKFCCGCGKQF